MKKTSTDNTKGTVKGMPSAVVLAIAIHVGLFFLAGALVVFKYVIKPEPDFGIVEQVVRPPRALKKPKVQVKKSSRPKATARITSQINPQAMPSIDLPAVSGFGEGLGDGLGGDGFEMMINIGDFTIVGEAQTDGSDLEGTFYDFNRTRDGKVNGMDRYLMDQMLRKFHASGWDERELRSIYRSPKKLYAKAIGIGPMPSPLVPEAFGEPDNMDQTWIVLYKGKLVHRDGISFRFVGNSDDKLAVRVDGKVVLDGSRGGGPGVVDDWLPDSADNRKWWICHDYSAVGNIVTLEPGVPKDIEIIIGEGPGTLFNAVLYVMEEGKEYPKKAGGVPILPLYKTSPLPRRLQDLIVRNMPKNEVNVTNGPIFNDFYSTTAEAQAAIPEPAAVEEAVPAAPPVEGGVRSWVTKDGKTYEGELVANMRRYVLIENPQGLQEKIPMESLSDEDLRYVTLESEPRVNVELSRRSQQRRLKYDTAGIIGINQYTFTATAECADKDYPYELKVNYWVLGKEIAGNAYILLDKGSGSFIPAETPDGRFEIKSPTIDLYNYVIRTVAYPGQTRGEGYNGYLITVTDERGKIIAHGGSPTWLYTHVDKLRKLETYSFIDDECNRIWPTPCMNSGKM